MKTNIQILRELNKIPNVTGPIKKEVESNLVCCCGKKIGKDDTYFMRLEPQEQPQVFCEFCIQLL